MDCHIGTRKRFAIPGRRLVVIPFIIICLFVCSLSIEMYPAFYISNWQTLIVQKKKRKHKKSVVRITKKKEKEKKEHKAAFSTLTAIINSAAKKKQALDKKKRAAMFLLRRRKEKHTSKLKSYFKPREQAQLCVFKLRRSIGSNALPSPT